jgi:hypothetical protein
MKCRLNDALPFLSIFDVRPQANAEAVFEISREIATAKNAVRDYGL